MRSLGASWRNVARGPYSLLDDQHLQQLEKLLGKEKVITEESLLDSYNTDWLKTTKGRGKAVLRPSSTEEVAAVMRFCDSKKLAVVPQGGNTGLVAGSVPIHDELILSLGLMKKILEIEPLAGWVRCEAGSILEAVDSALAEQSLMMPYDLGAKGSCQVGGNLATCAGGLRLLRYGTLHANTLALTVVSGDGQVMELGEKNRQIRNLMLGSEGTLGIITEAKIKTPPLPNHVGLAFLGLASWESVIEAAQMAKCRLSEGLSACEVMDATCLDAVTSAGVRPPLSPGPPFFLLLETHSTHSLIPVLSSMLEVLLDKGHALDAVVVSEPSKVKGIWEVRERITECLLKGMYVFKYDISLPQQRFYDIVLIMRERLKGSKAVSVSGFGHLGDGNLHLNIQAKEHDPKLEAMIEPFVYEWVSKEGGSMSAEHGIGLRKAHHLGLAKSPLAIDIMRNLKQTLDPSKILNPYKLLPPLE